MVFNKPFGRYTLIKRLAMGGMAEVFLALRRGPSRFQRPFALKCILEHVNDEPRHVEMFYNEARIGALFQHPNLIPVFDVEKIDGRHTMVMEFVAGHTVEELSRRIESSGKPLEVGHAVALIGGAALGLGHAHAARELEGSALHLVHRDISPANLLIGYDGSVRVFDFGVAVAAARGDSGGEMAGKTAYMSPEQCRGKTVDARSDIFSLGIVLHELLTGQRLFKRENHIKAIRAITDDEIPAPSTLREGIPEELDRIVLKALARPLDERFGDALELHVDLMKYLAQQGEVVEADELSALMERHFRDGIAELEALLRKATAAPEHSDATIDLSTFDVRTTRSIPAVPPPPPRSTQASAAVKGAGGDPNIQTEEGDGLEALRTGAYVAAIEAPRPSSTLGEQASAAIVERLDRAQRQNRTLMLVAGLLALAMVGVLAWSLTRPAPAPVAPPEAVVTQVAVQIVSEPPGATVVVNGEERSALTPSEILLDVGSSATIGVRMEGYEARDEVFTPTTQAGQELRFPLVVDRESQTAPIGSVRITYSPPDAQVLLDGEPQVGVSPLTLNDLRLNTELTLRFEKQGFETLYHRVVLDSDEMLDVQLAMSEAVDLGRWTITSEPAGATVRIDEVEVGVTPIENLELVANRTYTLELERAGYPRYRVQRQVRAGEVETITVALGRGARADGSGSSRPDAGEEEPNAATPPATAPAVEAPAVEAPSAEVPPTEEPPAEERPRYRILE